MKSKDLTLIFGVGLTYARALEGMGVATWEDLLAYETTTILKGLGERRYRTSARQVEWWKRHAESWKAGEPIFFGEESCVGDSFIALDLEYGPRVWLMGACLIEGDRREYLTLWADDARAERRNLQQLAELIAANPKFPVLTWSGLGADVPQLRNACHRLRLNGSLGALFKSHVDLFLYAKRNLRLPIAGLSLKDVAKYFGIPRLSGVEDGLQAQMMYEDYRIARSAKRKEALREELMDYNRDDLEALVAIAERIRDLSLCRAPHAGAPSKLVSRRGRRTGIRQAPNVVLTQ